MIRNLAQFLLAFITLISATFSVHAKAETLILDNTHTYVRWSIQHLGFSTQTGKWYATGELTIDKDNPKDSKVNVTIKMADMITGLPELDKHLKGKLFFDVAQYPLATFVSDKVDVLSKTTATVHGLLTLHGVTKPITLNVTMNKVGKNPINDKMTVGFSATTVIKRSDFGMNTLQGDLSDDVAIEIGVEAYQNNA